MTIYSTIIIYSLMCKNKNKIKGYLPYLDYSDPNFVVNLRRAIKKAVANARADELRKEMEGRMNEDMDFSPPY